MTNFKHTFLYFLFFAIAMLSACRGEEDITGSTSTPVTPPTPSDSTNTTPSDSTEADAKKIIGFYLLNEGNMGSNKASLDYFDYETGVYTKNIYAERNPNVVKELGDVGNDLQIYGNKLYAVINCSNFIEVMDVKNAKHIDAVSIPNCRYITFKDAYAYVSSYAGPVELGNYRKGYVAKIDTATLQVVDTCMVGRQPEEMAVVGDKLYIANSGGYTPERYDSTLSVIDLNTFKEIKKINVAINLHRVEADKYGYLWVSSRGDYMDNPPRTYIVDTKTDKVIKSLDMAVNIMTQAGDSLYVTGTNFSYVTFKNMISYNIVNIKTQTAVCDNFITDGTEKDIVLPYGLAVNPITHEIMVTDAKDYITPGKLYCYSPDGILKWSVTTGDIPAHIVFSEHKLAPLTIDNEK